MSVRTISKLDRALVSACWNSLVCRRTRQRQSGVAFRLLNQLERPSVRSTAPAGMSFSLEEIEANHALLEERNAVRRRFGFDVEASVRFVLEKAQPLCGRVLDVGTGKGRFVVALARHVVHVTTVDISAEEQRQAWLEAIYAGVANRIRFIVQDARFLPWPAASFDAVVSWNVFHHLDDPERVFAEMIRMVKPRGKLVLADFSPSGFRLMDAIHGAEGRRHPPPPSRFAHWQARLRSGGFHVRRFCGHHEELLVALAPVITP
jgi:ubiquinone/menaquinone biosynthesis C-methylase UbiE